MTFQTKVELTLADAAHTPLSGVQVQLYDRDLFTPDDRLGSGRTDQAGCVAFSYEERDFADIDDPVVLVRDRKANTAELYIQVLDRNGAVALTTRKSKTPPEADGVFRIRVPVDVAARYGFFRKTRNRKEKVAAWKADWEKRIAGDPKAPTDLCARRVFIDLMAGLAQPKSPLQREVAAAVSGQLSASEIATVAGWARDTRAVIDDSGLLDHKCAAKTPADFVNLLFGEGGTFNLNQALWATEPAPVDEIGVPAAGHYRSGYQLDPKCQQMFLAGLLTGRAAEDMAQIQHVDVVLPPSVRAIEVWSPFYRTTVRQADPEAKQLTVWKIRDQNGLASETVNMDVAIADAGNPDLLVAFDAGGGRQPLVVDVHPLQQVTFNGLGYAASKADLMVEFSPWRPFPAGQADAAALGVAGFEQTELWQGVGLVKGGPVELSEDRLAFEWPADRGSRPGLYRLRLRFPLPPGKKVTAGSRQDPGTCAIGLSDRYESAPLYFAVLPPLSSTPIKAVAAQVHCLETTNPRFWPDDIGWMGSIGFSRIAFDVTQPTPTARVSAETDRTWDAGDWRHFDMPADWNPQSNILPDGAGSREFTFGDDFHDVVAIQTLAAELDTDADRAALKLILKAGVIVLAAIVTVISVVVAVVVCIALAAWSPLTGGALVAVIGIVAAFTAAWVGFIFGTAFGLCVKGIDDIVDTTFVGAERITSGATVLTAGDVAVLTSKSRFVRRSLETNRPRSSGDASGEAISTSKVREDFQGERNGGRYRTSIEVAPAL